MDPKKGPQYMEKAIDKASKLIDLLTKQNKELKQENIHLQSQYEANLGQVSTLQEQKQKYQENINALSLAVEQKQAKFIQATNQIRILEQKLQQKSNKNKQLYQKLGEYASKNQELAKNMQKQKKKNLSLQNENEYLVKALSKYETKENQFHNYCQAAEQEFKKQMVMVDRTKQAFARKCQELKQQNGQMRRQLFLVNDKLTRYNAMEIQFLQSCDKIRELEQQIVKTNDVLSYIIESTLRIKPETGLYMKVEQIKNYINYRLQHIENLIKPIAEVVGSGQGKIRDLQALNSVVVRLSTYLGELLR